MSGPIGYLVILAGLVILVIWINHDEQQSLQRYRDTLPPKPPQDPYKVLQKYLQDLDLDDEDAYIHVSPPTPLFYGKATYMKSPEWHTRRKQVLKRDLYTCRICSATDLPLEVHHLHYQNLGNEPLEDLVSLCRDCHQFIHDIYGYGPNDTFPI